MQTVFALLILVITMCTRKSRRHQEEANPPPAKSVSGSQSLNVRLNYDRVSNSYQPVILRVESNGILTDIGTLNLPRLVPEDTQSVCVFSLEVFHTQSKGNRSFANRSAARFETE